MITLELATDFDLAFMRKIRNANCDKFFFPEKVTKIQHEAWWVKWLAADAGEFYIITKDDEAIGTISVSGKNPPWEIGNVILDKDYRGKGYLEEVISEIKKRYPGDILLRVRGDNEQAIKAYKKVGFRIRSLTMEL